MKALHFWQWSGRLAAKQRLFSVDHKSQFIVGPSNGFLPKKDPLPRLPRQFAKLEALLQNMPVVLPDGKAGLLGLGLVEQETRNIPQYRIDRIQNSHLLSALFRDYTFWASAYLLEPCDLSYRRTGSYGLGRDTLPPNIAVPLVQLADRLGAKPFLEYAYSYALNNYRHLDKNLRNEQGRNEFTNLALIRAFAGTPSEAGFILVHVAMVAHSPSLVRASLTILDQASRNERAGFNLAMKELITTMERINQAMETMWRRSSDRDYQHFRTFIMGIKNQPMFPHGVRYLGVDELCGKQSNIKRYRGESGANDSMIPCCDNLLQLYDQMPDNPLTRILKDFRTYRPREHNKFLTYVYKQANKVGVASFSFQDPVSTLLYIEAVDQIRQFRTRHWGFTKEYILKHTTHPVATGGSPIVTWLPNQLNTVLRVMLAACDRIDRRQLSIQDCAKLDQLYEKCCSQERSLSREVEQLQARFPNQPSN